MVGSVLRGAMTSIEISRRRTARRYVLGAPGAVARPPLAGHRGRGLGDPRDREASSWDPLVLVARAQDLMLHAPSARLSAGRLGAADVRAAAVLRLGRLARRSAHRGASPFPRRHAPRRRAPGAAAGIVAETTPKPSTRCASSCSERGPRSGTATSTDGRSARGSHSYRGRKDSALALHYLWRKGEAMVARRERFERIYARTEAVAPGELIRESPEAVADDFLLMKTVAAEGLTKLNGVYGTLLRRPTRAELDAWRARQGRGRRARRGRGGGGNAELRAVGGARARTAKPAARPRGGPDAGGLGAGCETSATEEVACLAHRWTRGSAPRRPRRSQLFGFEYVWEDGCTPVEKRPRSGPEHDAGPVGRRAGGAGWTRGSSRATGTLVVNGLWARRTPRSPGTRRSPLSARPGRWRPRLQAPSTRPAGSTSRPCRRAFVVSSSHDEGPDRNHPDRPRRRNCK